MEEYGNGYRNGCCYCIGEKNNYSIISPLLRSNDDTRFESEEWKYIVDGSVSHLLSSNGKSSSKLFPSIFVPIFTRILCMFTRMI